MDQKGKRKLLDFAGKYKYLTYLACVLSSISALLALVPFICIWKASEIIFRALPDVSNADSAAVWGVWAVVFAVVSMLVYFAALMCSHIAAFRTAKNMRTYALRHLAALPLGYFGENGSGKLRRIIDESAGQTESFLAHQLPDLAAAYATPIGVVLLILVFNWQLGLISLIPFIIGMHFLSRMTGPEMANSMKEYQSSLEDMNNEAVEYIRGIPVVKTFGQSIFSFKRFYNSIMRYKKWVVQYTISLRMPMCCYTVSINAVFALLVPAGILLIASAVDYQAFLIDFIFYVIFTPIFTVMLNKIMFSSNDRLVAKDALVRIESILDEKPLTQPLSGQVPSSNTIAFHNVSFCYPGAVKAALDTISFEVKEGQTVALVGPSGGGKTTAACLIPRFWDVDEGRVTIGGVNVKEIAQEELMSRVSFVFQENKLFKTSLLENIRFAKPEATRQEVQKAAEAAMCQDIIAKMPQGLDTVVGTRGVYLSGGEVQRITLARAILKDAPIIILDEATAFADPENEYQIQKAFEKLTKGKTVIMIAHRLSTVKNADQILVLSNGSIVEQGTHENLVEKNGMYAKMWSDYNSSIQWKVSAKGGAVV